MGKPNPNQSTELYLEKRLLIKILWECELLGNNDDFLLLKVSSDPFPKCSPVICGLLATQCNKFSIKKKERERERRSPPSCALKARILEMPLACISTPVANSSHLLKGLVLGKHLSLIFFFSHPHPPQQLLLSLHLDINSGTVTGSCCLSRRWARSPSKDKST